MKYAEINLAYISLMHLHLKIKSHQNTCQNFEFLFKSTSIIEFSMDTVVSVSVSAETKILFR